MPDEERDVIEILEHDHREVEQMFDELEALRSGSSDEAISRRKDLKDDVTIERARHSVAEEVPVYRPVGEKIGADQVEHAREEHAEAGETLARLEKLDPGDAAFDELRTMGSPVEAFRQVAPTRPCMQTDRRRPSP